MSAATPVETSPDVLAPFSACTVSDALLRLDVPHGGYLPDVVLRTPATGNAAVVGSAYTIRMVKPEDATAPPSVHFADAVPAGSIVVVGTPDESTDDIMF